MTVAHDRTKVAMFLADAAGDSFLTGREYWLGKADELIGAAKAANECPTCGGSGFSGYGTGYGDVCAECGGQRVVHTHHLLDDLERETKVYVQSARTADLIARLRTAFDRRERITCWLREVVALDWNEIVADGGITAAMVIQQEAREELRRLDRDSDGTATAAACEDMPVPKDCQARAESIAQPKTSSGESGHDPLD